jgi:hypothetical protein
MDGIASGVQRVYSSCSRELSAAVSASKTQLTDTLPQQTPNLLMINDARTPSSYSTLLEHWHKYCIYFVYN